MGFVNPKTTVRLVHFLFYDRPHSSLRLDSFAPKTKSPIFIGLLSLVCRGGGLPCRWRGLPAVIPWRGVSIKNSTRFAHFLLSHLRSLKLRLCSLGTSTKNPDKSGSEFLFAEEEGFEPPDPCGSPVFKTGAINRSTTPL